MLRFPEVTTILRDLAKTLYYQTLYIREDLQIFNNNTDLSDVQLTFIGLLGFYHSLNMEVNMGEVDDKVYECHIFEDAYIYYKYHKDKKKTEELRDNSRPQPSKQQGNRSEQVTKSKSQWIFK